MVVANAGTSTMPVRAQAQAPAFDHIFVMVEENHDYSEIIGNPQAPYINGLASQNGVATQYTAVSHPSLPNYLALTGGSTFGVTSDCAPTACPVNAPNIADRIEGAGKTWKAYMDAMPSACGTSDAGTYAVRHNPFVYYNDIRNDATRCANHVVPYSNLAADLASASTTPNFAWVTPDVCNDMHDCSVSAGDTWLQNNLPALFNSPAWTTQKSLLLLTWDEGSSANQVPTLVISPAVARGYQSPVAYSHYSLLSTVESAWGLSPLSSGDGTASPMTDFFAGAVTGTVTSASGAPISGAIVAANTGGASTDGSGAYTLTGLSAGSQTITAYAAGFKSQALTVKVTAGQTTQGVTFSLAPRSGNVTGTVTNASGGTIPGAIVATNGVASTTDGSGVYALALSPGSQTLTAYAAGFKSQTLTVSVTSGQTTQGVNFSLAPRTGAVTGAVTNASSGTPIAGATVRDSGGATITTDSSGTYTLSGLSPGSHTLTASATGLASATLSASVVAGQTTQGVNFSLTPVTPTPRLIQAAGAAESTASTSLTATFATSTSAGHLLVLSASVYTGTSNPIASVTDSSGNTWTRIAALSSPGHNSDGEMWYAANARAATSVTIHTAGAAVVALGVQEFSGISTASPLDASAGTSSSGTAAASGSVKPTAAGDMAVGFLAGHSSPQAISASAPGYTVQTQQTSSSGPAITSVVTGYQVLTSTSASAFTGSFPSAVYWAAGIACFKAGA